MENDINSNDEVGNFDFFDILSQNSQLNDEELDQLVQNAVPESTNNRSTYRRVTIFTEWYEKWSIYVDFNSATAIQLNDIP